MKIAAICLSGHIRNYENSRPGLNLLLESFKDYKIDTYISTWEDLDTSDGPKGVERKGIHEGKIDKKKIAEFYNNPKEIKICKYENWRKLFLYQRFIDKKPEGYPGKYYVVNDVLICAPQIFQMWSCFNLLKKEYDLIIRARPDFLPTKVFSVKESEKIVFPRLFEENGKIFAVDDRFCYGKFSSMKVFYNLWPNLREVIENYDAEKFPYPHNETNCQQLAAEKILHRWLVENNLNFEYDNDIELIRV